VRTTVKSAIAQINSKVSKIVSVEKRTNHTLLLGFEDEGKKFPITFNSEKEMNLAFKGVK